jgi:Fe-S cluster assembly protein SufB
MPAVQETVDQVRRIDVDQYKYGFETIIESDKAPKGLNEDIVRFISAKKNEPAWMLAWRLDAYRRWLTMREPLWARVSYGPIDYQNIYYYSAPKKKDGPKSLDEIDPEILATYEKLGIPLREREALLGIQKPQGDADGEPEGEGGGNGYRRVAVDAVFDSVSVATTFQEELAKAGVLFMPISEALQKHPDLVKKYLGTVVPISDNFFATLNSAVFSDGSFVYVPPGVRCPMELSTYFRINERNTGQFERTLIIADKGSYVSYLEGCTAPTRDENQLHAAVVELIALDDAEIKYSTIQNWYPGDANGRGGVYNFVTKRGDCRGVNSKISWTQLETGDHLEISELHPARRQFAWRVLLDRDLERPSAGRFWNQDAASGQEHDQPHHLQGHRRRSLQQHLSRPGDGAPAGDGCAQLHQLRLAADRRQVRCAHHALHRGEERFGGVRARGDHLEDFRGYAVLLQAAGPLGGGRGGAGG